MEDKFLQYMKNNSLSDNTCENYIRDIKQYKSYYYDSYGEELVTLIHSDILTYITYLKSHDIAAKSINRKLAALKQYNLYLIENHIQDNIVIKDKDYIKLQNTNIKKPIPKEKDVKKLLHTTCIDTKNPKRDYCFIVLFVHSGVRESEILSIKLTDIDLDLRLIKIIGKGNKFRKVIINDIMYDAITEYLEERNKINTENPYLFVGQKNKNTKSPLSRNFGNRLLNKYKELCNIATLHPHLLRSYFCTKALEVGYTIAQVADQAGHSSLNTTKGYIGVDLEDMISLANKL